MTVTIVETLLREQAPTRFKGSVAPDERMKIWRESAKNLPRAPLLSDDAIRRESIYGDRGQMSVLIDSNVLPGLAHCDYPDHLAAIELVARLFGVRGTSLLHIPRYS